MVSVILFLVALLHVGLFTIVRRPNLTLSICFLVTVWC